MQYKFTLFTKNGISVPSALTQIFSSIEDMVIWLNANVEADTFQLDVASNKIIASSIDGNKYFSTIECVESVDCAVIENCIRNNPGTIDAIRDLVEELLTNDTTIRDIICGIDCTPAPTIPNNVTNLSTTDAGGGAYDCGNPILTWTASSGATSYDVFEGATLLGNTATTTFTVTGASVGSHTYIVKAVNAVGSSSGVSVTVNVINCLAAPGNVSGTINVYNSGTVTTYTCGTDFDVDFTDVATATYYQLFEGATQIGSNSSTSNFVVTGQTAGSHTYTIKACNLAGCSTGTNFTVNVVACVSTLVDLTGQEFSSSSFVLADDAGRTLNFLQNTQLGTAINADNNAFTACGGGSLYNNTNGSFIVPTTGSYTFSFGIRLDGQIYSGGAGWNVSAAIYPVNNTGVYSGVPWGQTNTILIGDTSFSPFNFTVNLTAGTCYTVIVGTIPFSGMVGYGSTTMNNFIIS